MPKYLLQASYTAEGLKGLLKEKAAGRRAALMSAVEALGGKLDAMYYTLGEHDGFAIIDLPNIQAATALSVSASASGFVRTSTTALLTVDEVDQALSKSVTYHPPGR